MKGVFEALTAFLATPEGQTLIGAVLAALATYATRALNAIRKKNDADSQKTGFQIALEKSLNLIEVVAPRIWKRLQPELQQDLLDGKIDEVEMKRIEAVIEEELRGLLTSEGLKQLAKALGYELPGFIAWFAAKLLSYVGVAKDASDPSVPNGVADVHFQVSSEMPKPQELSEEPVVLAPNELPNGTVDGSQAGG